MRILSSLIIATAFVLPMALAACGDDGDDGEDADPFDTLMDCYNEHHNVESLPTQQAIVTCCLDHPIAGVKPACGESEDACDTFVGDNLDDTISDDDITAACATYADQRGF